MSSSGCPSRLASNSAASWARYSNGVLNASWSSLFATIVVIVGSLHARVNDRARTAGGAITLTASHDGCFWAPYGRRAGASWQVIFSRGCGVGFGVGAPRQVAPVTPSKLLSRFPYAIAYELHADAIVVVAAS